MRIHIWRALEKRSLLSTSEMATTPNTVSGLPYLGEGPLAQEVGGGKNVMKPIGLADEAASSEQGRANEQLTASGPMIS